MDSGPDARGLKQVHETDPKTTRSTSLARSKTTGLDCKRYMQCRVTRTVRGYVVTKSLDDFGPAQGMTTEAPQITRVPAVQLCY